jgi:hypothetical protein
MDKNEETFQPQQAARQLIKTETASVAVAEQAKALVFAHYELALRHPRDVDQARQSLLKDCQRPSFAEVARYNKPIGKGVFGPSIRFAEAAIRCYRNILIMTQTTFDDLEKRIINVRVKDVEYNIGYDQDVTITKTVERKRIRPGETYLKTRMNSKGEMLYIIEATDDDILNKQNALISKAIRTQGLRLIPGDLIDECMDAVIATQNKRDAEDPDSAKKKIYDSFALIGVKAEDIKEYLGTAADSLTPKELLDLRGIYQAIKDGEISWRDVIDKAEKKRDAPQSPLFGDAPKAPEKPAAAIPPGPTKEGPAVVAPLAPAAPVSAQGPKAPEPPKEKTFQEMFEELKAKLKDFPSSDVDAYFFKEKKWIGPGECFADLADDKVKYVFERFDLFVAALKAFQKKQVAAKAGVK